jgi:hypothetical protein
MGDTNVVVNARAVVPVTSNMHLMSQKHLVVVVGYRKREEAKEVTSSEWSIWNLPSFTFFFKVII